MEVNFFVAVELIRAALPTLRQGRRPMIVNVGSILGHRGIPHMAEYCASKFALAGFSEALRAEVARLGIDVLVVSPGTTATDFHDHLVERTDKPPWPQQPRVPPAVVAKAAEAAVALKRLTGTVVSRRGVYAKASAACVEEFLQRSPV